MIFISHKLASVLVSKTKLQIVIDKGNGEKKEQIKQHESIYNCHVNSI